MAIFVATSFWNIGGNENISSSPRIRLILYEKNKINKILHLNLKKNQSFGRFFYTLEEVSGIQLLHNKRWRNYQTMNFTSYLVVTNFSNRNVKPLFTKLERKNLDFFYLSNFEIFSLTWRNEKKWKTSKQLFFHYFLIWRQLTLKKKFTKQNSAERVFFLAFCIIIIIKQGYKVFSLNFLLNYIH